MINDIHQALELNRLASENDKDGVIEILSRYTKSETFLCQHILIEMCRLPFENMELFEDEQFRTVWEKCISTNNVESVDGYVYHRLYEMIIQKDKRASLLLEYFWEFLKMYNWTFCGVINKSFSVVQLAQLAVCTQDDNFLLKLTDMFINSEDQYKTDWRLKSLLVEYFFSRGMIYDFERVFDAFFETDLRTMMWSYSFDYNVDRLMNIIGMIDYIAKDSDENEQLKSDLFMNSINNFNNDSGEIIKKLNCFKESGFRIKKLNMLLSVFRIIDGDSQQCFADILDDEAVLYIQSLNDLSVNDSLNFIDAMAKLKPDLKISIDNLSTSGMDFFCDSAILSVKFVKNLIKNHKLTYSQSLRDNKYITLLVQRNVKALIPVIDHICSNDSGSTDELIEIMAEHKNFEALNYIMNMKK